MRRFVDQADDAVAGIRQAVLDEDSEALRSRAHQLGGSAANLGAQQVAGVCSELELLGHHETAIGVAEVTSYLEQAMGPAVAALRDELS